VKWIPKDQEVTIDHSTRHEHPSQALEFACNVLQLMPKRIWIEDEKGVLHTDHQAIVSRIESDERTALPFSPENASASRRTNFC
jgi:hypothetical protein